MTRPPLLHLAALAVLLPLTACGQAPPPPAPIVRPVLSVIAHAVKGETLGPYVGLIQPRYETPLSFQASGRIISRPVKVGDAVKKGERLASLDPSVQQYALAEAQASVASAQSQYTNLAAAAERAKALVSNGATAQAQLDQATTAAETAQAQLAQAEASLARAKNELGYTTITAGFDGVVVSTGAEIGQVVGAGQTVVTIARPDVREAVFELPEAAAAAGAPGASWTVGLAGSDETTAGTVREVTPLYNAATRSQTVRLSLPAAPETFRLGAMVTVSARRPVPPHYSLPATAILDQDGKTLVWLVDPQALTVSAHPVTLGAKTNGTVAVTAGLKEGDRVVIAGVHSLTAGEKVKLDGEGG
jgi:RND family efflux transporter MFP subunit